MRGTRIKYESIVLSIPDPPGKSQRNRTMKIAVFADIHDNAAALDAVLRDAARQGADHLVCLGDVGHDARLFDRLHEADIACTFGNWEVSGLARMAAARQAWVGAWPACIRLGDAILCHATPDMPADAATTRAAAVRMRSGTSWTTLFPRLDSNENAVWQALAALEETNMRVAFHGHTHVQKIWSWSGAAGNTRRLAAVTLPAATLVLEPGTNDAASRYIVGVGSIGQPQDGPTGGYALWDRSRMTVTLRRLPV